MTRPGWKYGFFTVVACLTLGSLIAWAQQEVLLQGMGTDSKVHTLQTDTSGRLIVSIGGASGSNLSTMPVQCATSEPENVVSVPTTAGGTAVPTTQTANRQYVVLTNSKANVSGLVKCRADGVAPVYATGGGTVLAVGDSILYSVPAGVAPLCISSAGNVLVSYVECVP